MHKEIDITTPYLPNNGRNILYNFNIKFFHILRSTIFYKRIHDKKMCNFQFIKKLYIEYFTIHL